LLDFIQTQQLPHHKYKRTCSTVLEDEDISQEIQFELGEKVKSGPIKASDLVEVIASPKMQDWFCHEPIPWHVTKPRKSGIL
jgi:hypothetical protein